MDNLKNFMMALILRKLSCVSSCPGVTMRWLRRYENLIFYKLLAQNTHPFGIRVFWWYKSPYGRHHCINLFLDGIHYTGRIIPHTGTLLLKGRVIQLRLPLPLGHDELGLLLLPQTHREFFAFFHRVSEIH